MLSGGGDARRAATAVVCRFLVLGTLLPWAVAPSAAASAGAAHGGSLATVPVSAMPEGLADDARTGRVFVVTMHYAPPYDGAVIVLDAHSGKVLRSTPLSVAAAHSGAASGRRRPVSAGCPGCIAVDDRSGRVFVLSPGLPGAPNSPMHPPAYVFVFDGTSGRLLATTSLVIKSPDSEFAPAVVVDPRTNRVFSSNGGTNRLSVLDAPTGRLLHTVVFPNHQGPDPSPVVPLGIDSRDGWVLVSAPDGPAAVDERTGKAVRAIHLPDGQGVDEGLVDGRRGRAVLAVVGGGDGALSFSVETVKPATGKVVGTFGTGEAGHLLAIDEQTGRALVFQAAPHGAPLPGYLSVMEDAAGTQVGGFALPQASYAAVAAATVNPATGHALVVVAYDRFGGSTHLLVVDLRTGKKLRDMPLGGVPGYGQLSIAADGPTRHVFVTTPSLNSVTMLDATKL